MSDESYKFNPDVKETEFSNHLFETTNEVVKRLLESCLSTKCFNHIDSNCLPSLESVATVIHQARNIINKKRHPTIEDDVVIYANATVLGGRTVVGKGSTIGGNVWIIDERIPPNTKVVLKKPELIYSAGNNNKLSPGLPEKERNINFVAETGVPR